MSRLRQSSQQPCPRQPPVPHDGVGRNLEDRGITKAEALYLLENDIERCRREARDFAWFRTLDSVRQDVVISMIFNLGLAGFKKFRNAIMAIQAGKYELASKELLDSLWAKQVGSRAIQLAHMMRTGSYPET